MLIIPVKDNKGIEMSLKVFKSKTFKTGLIKEIRERKEYKKPSVKRREEKSLAIYRQKMSDNE